MPDFHYCRLIFLSILHENTHAKDGNVWPSSAVSLEFPIFHRTDFSASGAIAPTRLHPRNVQTLEALECSYRLNRILAITLGCSRDAMTALEVASTTRVIFLRSSPCGKIDVFHAIADRSEMRVNIDKHRNHRCEIALGEQ